MYNLLAVFFLNIKPGQRVNEKGVFTSVDGKDIEKQMIPFFKSEVDKTKEYKDLPKDEKYGKQIKDYEKYLTDLENTIKFVMNPPKKYIRSESWFKKLIHTYNQSQAGDRNYEPYAFYELTANQKKERKQIQDLAQNNFAKALSRFNLAGFLLNSKVNQIANNIGYEKKLQFQRNATIMVTLFAKDSEDLLKNVEILATGSKEQRQHFFDMRINYVLNMLNDCMYGRTPLEYADRIEELLPIYQLLTEIDGDKIPKLAKQFGVDLSKEMEEKIKSISLISTAVGSATNVIGNLVNPLYSEVSEANCAAVGDALSAISNLPGFKKDAFIEYPGSYERLLAGTDCAINPVSELGKNYTPFVNVSGTWVKEEFKVHLKNNPGLKYIAEDGNELNVTTPNGIDTLIEQLNKDKRILVYDANGIFRSYMTFNKGLDLHINYHDHKNGIDFRIPKVAKNNISFKLEDLNKWYNLKNSEEFEDVLKDIKALNAAIDSNKPIATLLGKLQKSALRYLESKYPAPIDKPKNTRTYMREEFCADLIHSCDEYLGTTIRFNTKAKVEVKKITGLEAKKIEDKALSDIIQLNKENEYKNTAEIENQVKNVLDSVKVTIDLEEEKKEPINENKEIRQQEMIEKDLPIV